MQVKAQLAHQNLDQSRNLQENQHLSGNVGGQQFNPFCSTNYMNHPISPQSSLESIDYSSGSSSININDGMSMQDIQSGDHQDFSFFQACSKERISSSYNNDLGELQELALRMMRNYN